jgi:hypothetical protein
MDFRIVLIVSTNFAAMWAQANLTEAFAAFKVALSTKLESPSQTPLGLSQCKYTS